MSHYLNWMDVVLIGWVLISVLVTPLVGRFLGDMSADPGKDNATHDEAISIKAPHDTVDA